MDGRRSLRLKRKARGSPSGRSSATRRARISRAQESDEESVVPFVSPFHDGSWGKRGEDSEGGSALEDERQELASLNLQLQQLQKQIREVHSNLTNSRLSHYFTPTIMKLADVSVEAEERIGSVVQYSKFLSKYEKSCEGTSRGYFTIIPEEICLNILSYLSIRELQQSVMPVSKFWKRIAEDDAIWDLKYRQYFANCVSRDEITPGVLKRMRELGRNGRVDPSHPSALTFPPGGLHDDDDDDGDDGDDVRHEDDDGDVHDEDESSMAIESPARRSLRRVHKHSAPMLDDHPSFKQRFHNRHVTAQNWMTGNFTLHVVKERLPAPETVYCVKFNRKFVITGGNDRSVYVRDLYSNETVHTLSGHRGEVRAVDLDDEKFVSGCRERFIKVWDAETGNVVVAFMDHAGPVKCLQLDGNIIMSGSEDSTIKAFDIRQRKPIQSLEGHQWGVATLQFNAKYVASGSRDRQVMLWDRRTGDRIFKLSGHINTVRCVALDDTHVVSGSWDNTLKVWSTTSGEDLVTLKGHSSRVLCVAFDGSKIVSGSVDNTVKVWDIKKYDKKWMYSLVHHDEPYYLQVDDYGIMSANRCAEIVLWDFQTPSDTCHMLKDEEPPVVARYSAPYVHPSHAPPESS